MNEFLSLSKDDQNLLVVNSARKLGMSPAIIEKDFWVCFMLEYLFTSFQYKNKIYFKGGTSLSKIYNCIERFSEDIDLAIDWSIIGLTKEIVYESRSKNKQDIFNKETNKKTELCLKNEWLPIIQNDLEQKISESFSLFIEDNDPQTICFQYPRIYQDTSILQIIRLEIGALAEPIPSEFKKVKSYISGLYPDIINDENALIQTMEIKRTFFEKLTILHREANRLNNKYPLRYSRHYYDLYMMIESDVAKTALDDIHLLKTVIDFKMKFYPCNWSNYEDILIGKCKLIPSDTAISFFTNDYENMRNMIFGKCPTFDIILSTLRNFERIVNDKVRVNFKS